MAALVPRKPGAIRAAEGHVISALACARPAHSMIDAEEREKDTMIAAESELNVARLAAHPLTARELIAGGQTA